MKIAKFLTAALFTFFSITIRDSECPIKPNEDDQGIIDLCRNYFKKEMKKK